MYSYKIQIKKVSGRLNESALPKKNLVLKSKKLKTDKAVFAEASKFIKNKYGLTLESANVNGGQEISVYVGTWGKYAGGSIDGGWVKLSDFSSPKEYHEYLRTKLHADEGENAEYMIQDVEGPAWVRDYIGEYGMNEEFVWGYINLDEYEKPIVDGWLEVSGTKYDDIDEAVSDATDHYVGGEGQDYDEWLYDFLRETSGTMSTAEMINGQYYNWIDWDRVKQAILDDQYTSQEEDDWQFDEDSPELDDEAEMLVRDAYSTFNDLDDVGFIDWGAIQRDMKFEFDAADNGCVYHSY